VGLAWFSEIQAPHIFVAVAVAESQEQHHFAFTDLSLRGRPLCP
jgi:hypothetical protein